MGLRLGSSITGSMHSRIVLDIYLGCKPARVKVFSGLFKHFFPLMYCLPCYATTLTGSDPWNFHGFSGLRLQFWFGIFLLLVCTIMFFSLGSFVTNLIFPLHEHLIPLDKIIVVFFVI